MKRKAIVAGATGLVGQELVQLLLQDHDYEEVTMLVRRPVELTHPKLQVNVIDFDRLKEADIPMEGADVYCTLGTTIKKAGTQEAFRKVDYTYPLVLGQMAESRGAKRFMIVTATGANASSRIFYSRVKGEIEEALKELGLGELHIFRPSLLLGDRGEFRAGERLMGVFAPLFKGPLRAYGPVQARSVAAAMLRAAKEGLPGVHVHESRDIPKK